MRYFWWNFASCYSRRISINLLGEDWNKPGEPGPAPIILVICEWAVEYEATAAAAAEFAAFGPGEVTLIW